MSREPKLSNRKAIVWVVGATLIVAASYLWLNTRATPFDAAVWRAGENASSDEEAPRLRMADGLVQSGALLGKARADVEAMLGQPTETSKFRNYDLVYWLGPERGIFSIDSEWLVVRFGPDGRVVEAAIVRD